MHNAFLLPEHHFVLLLQILYISLSVSFYHHNVKCTCEKIDVDTFRSIPKCDTSICKKIYIYFKISLEFLHAEKKRQNCSWSFGTIIHSNIFSLKSCSRFYIFVFSCCYSCLQCSQFRIILRFIIFSITLAFLKAFRSFRAIGAFGVFQPFQLFELFQLSEPFESFESFELFELFKLKKFLWFSSS